MGRRGRWVAILSLDAGQVNESDGVGTVAQRLLLQNLNYTHDRGF
jgi:hypothetical protein